MEELEGERVIKNNCAFLFLETEILALLIVRLFFLKLVIKIIKVVITMSILLINFLSHICELYRLQSIKTPKWEHFTHISDVFFLKSA